MQKFGALSLVGSGKSFLEVARRPNLTLEDARRDRAQLPVGRARRLSGSGLNTRSRMYYGDAHTKQMGVLGATENFAAVNFAKVEMGRLFIPAEVERRRHVVVLGQGPYQALFPNVDPLGKEVRLGSEQFTVIGVLGKRPNAGGLAQGVDDFVIIPYTTHRRSTARSSRGRPRSPRTASIPRSSARP